MSNKKWISAALVLAAAGCQAQTKTRPPGVQFRDYIASNQEVKRVVEQSLKRDNAALDSRVFTGPAQAFAQSEVPGYLYSSTCEAHNCGHGFALYTGKDAKPFGVYVDRNERLHWIGTPPSAQKLRLVSDYIIFDRTSEQKQNCTTLEANKQQKTYKTYQLCEITHGDVMLVPGSTATRAAVVVGGQEQSVNYSFDISQRAAEAALQSMLRALGSARVRQVDQPGGTIRIMEWVSPDLKVTWAYQSGINSRGERFGGLSVVLENLAIVSPM